MTQHAQHGRGEHGHAAKKDFAPGDRVRVNEPHLWGGFHGRLGTVKAPLEGYADDDPCVLVDLDGGNGPVRIHKAFLEHAAADAAP